GMLGRPVVRRLLKEDFAVRVMARDTTKAAALLPSEVEIVKGDLKDIDSIRHAATGADIVYLSLATERHKAAFRPELDGTKNVIEALSDRDDIVISKLSALGVKPTNGWWLDVDQKCEAEELIKGSGHPYIIFRPSWFHESLPLFIQKNRLAIMGRPPHPVYWISGDDYGRMVAEAFRKNLINRTFNAQGTIPMTFDEAAEQFIRAYKPEMKIIHIPLFVLKISGLFNPQLKELSKLFSYYKTYAEKIESESAWEALYRPRMTVAEYVEYMQRTGDIPSKR
ncbi:MAG: NAD(P)H-binding protein, partial [Candidatus Zixiibacteriota bacterium]